MKKIFITVAAVMLVICLAVTLGACKDDKTDMTTTAPVSETGSTLLNADDGKITDESEEGSNGAAGQLVSDISEGLTDVSKDTNG